MEMTYGEYLKEEEAGKTVSSIPFFEELKKKNIRPEMGIEFYEPNTGGYSVIDADSLTEDDEIFVSLDRDDLPFSEEDQEDRELPEEPDFVKQLKDLQSELSVELSFDEKAVFCIDSGFSDLCDYFDKALERVKKDPHLVLKEISIDTIRSYIAEIRGSIFTLYTLNFLSLNSRTKAFDCLDHYLNESRQYIYDL